MENKYFDKNQNKNTETHTFIVKMNFINGPLENIKQLGAILLPHASEKGKSCDFIFNLYNFSLSWIFLDISQ